MQISMELSEKNYIYNRYLWDMEEIRLSHEAELSTFFQKYILQNKKFKKDDLLNLRTYNIYFIPTSEAYKKWGDYVTVVQAPDEFKEEIISYNQQQIDPFGEIKVCVMSNGKELQLRIIKFSLTEVFDIEG